MEIWKNLQIFPDFPDFPDFLDFPDTKPGILYTFQVVLGIAMHRSC